MWLLKPHATSKWPRFQAKWRKCRPRLFLLQAEWSGVHIVMRVAGRQLCLQDQTPIIAILNQSQCQAQVSSLKFNDFATVQTQISESKICMSLCATRQKSYSYPRSGPRRSYPRSGPRRSYPRSGPRRSYLRSAPCPVSQDFDFEFFEWLSCATKVEDLHPRCTVVPRFGRTFTYDAVCPRQSTDHM